MELKDIQELIDKDQATRQKVSDAHQLKYDIKQKIAEDKQKISDKVWFEVNYEVDQIKKELDREIQQAELDNTKNFQDGSGQIEEIFQSKKDEWCKTILKHCLD